MPPPSQYMLEVYPVIKWVLNCASIACGGLCVILYLLVWLRKPQMVNRVSLRLQLGVACVDIARHVLMLFGQVSDTPHCELVAALVNMCNLMYFFLATIIALNLQAAVIHNCRPRLAMEIVYYIIALGVPVIMVGIGIPLKIFGAGRGGICFFDKNAPNLSLVVVMYQMLPLFSMLTLCAISSAVVLLTVKCDPSKLQPFLNDKGPPEFREFVRLLLFRITLYPISCIFVWSGCVGYTILSSWFDYRSDFTLSWYGITNYMGGILNLATFLLDPQLQLGLKAIFFPKKRNMVDSLPFNDSGLDVDSKASIEMMLQADDIRKHIRFI